MMNRKKKGLFGSTSGGFVATREQQDESRRLEAMFPGAQAPVNEGFNERLGAMSVGMPQQAEPQKPKTDWGAIGRNVMGNVGDAIAQHYGVAPVYAPSMEQQRQAQMIAEQQRQKSLADIQKREADREEWLYRQQHDKPAIQQNAEYIRQTQGDEAANTYLQNYGKGQEETIVRDIPGVGTYIGPVSGLRDAVAQGSGVVQPGAVEDGYRFKGGDPRDRNNWEPVGGPTQPASGNFRR